MPRVADGARHIPRRLPAYQRSGSERRSKLFREELRLLPGREVPALGQPIVVDQLREGFLGPAARRGIDFVRKSADRDRNGHALGSEESELALPEETRRRDAPCWSASRA